MTKARSELNQILDSVHTWETTTPLRARRFHAARRELESQVRLSLSSWWPWVGEEVIARYRDRTRRLGDVAESLVTLIADAERLESEVRALEDGLRSSDAELAEWMRGRCRDWIATLGRLGGACDRSADIFAEQNVLAQTEAAVRLHDEAVRELREIDRVVVALGDQRAVSLTARLPEFRRRLYDEGAKLPWLTELRGVLEPLKTIADRVSTPPPEVMSLTQALTDARGWSRRLGGEGSEELQRLAERNFTSADFDPAEVQEVATQTNALLARLIAHATDLRATRVETLRLQMNDLRRACGMQAELDAQLAQLEQQASDHPQLFRDWMHDADAFVEHFHAIAQTHHGEIERRLSDATAKVEKRLDELDTRPLSEEVRKSVAYVRREVRLLPRDVDTQQMLQQLRRIAEIEQEIAALASRAEEELVEIDARQQRLSGRNHVLQEEAARVKRLKIDTADLSERISALSDTSVEVSLEERRRQIDELSLDLDALEAAFIDGCRTALAERVVAIERTIRALRASGVAEPCEVPAIVGADASLHDATEAVLGARRQHESLLQRARAISKELETQRQQAHDDLSRLRADDLGPADRELAVALLHELDPASWPETRALLDRIELLAVLRDKCAMFFERLRQEEQGARERHAELQARLREFNQDQLHRFCPELSERVTALVYGIPAHPRQWAAVHHQLDVAGELFNRVDTQARRLAADELDRAAETLRQRAAGAGGGSFRASAQALLDELDARNHESLAPVALRLRVVGASRRRG